MVKELDTEELNEHLHNDPFGLQLVLTKENISEWTSSGKWKHIKKELRSIPNVEFGCSSTDSGCVYYFFFYSYEMQRRFINLLKALENDTEISLVNSSKEQLTETRKPCQTHPTATTCNLF